MGSSPEGLSAYQGGCCYPSPSDSWSSFGCTKIDPPANGNEASAFAHAIGGGLVGWALVEALRPRIRDWLSVALVALSVVIVLTLVWEIGEYAGDRLFDTALDPGWRDSAIDIFFGTAGGIVGIAFAGLAVSLRRAN